MSGMGMSDIGKFRQLESAVSSLSDRIISLEDEVKYWKDRSDILERYCKSARKLFDDDAIKRVVETESNITKDDPGVSQDKVGDPEDYKLIAEKAKAENAVLREEIERLHETLRFIQVLSKPDSQPKAPKVTGSIQ